MPRRRQIDRWLLGATLLTAAFGVVMVKSASAHLSTPYGSASQSEYAVRQLVAVVLGFAAMLAATFVPLRRLASWKLAMPALGLTWIALATAYLQPAVAHTHRWLRLPMGSFQPSALAKIVLPLALAVFIVRRRQQDADERLTLLGALGIIAVTCALVLFEPDLGSAALLLVTGAAVLLLAGAPWRPLAAAGASAVVLLSIFMLAAPYRRQRLVAFLGDPSYQVHQSLIAVGGGGFFGRGPGQSIQKLFFLPQPHSDFIFSIIGEELGFVGATLTLVALGLIVTRAFMAARRAPTAESAMLAGGLATAIAVQALLNVSVCIDLAPAKGIPLPLLSAGGSDVVMTLMAIGLLLNVGKEGA